MTPNDQIVTAKVIFFNVKKGWGLCQLIDSDEIFFLHWKNITNLGKGKAMTATATDKPKFKSVRAGAFVSFRTGSQEGGNYRTALDIWKVETPKPLTTVGL